MKPLKITAKGLLLLTFTWAFNSAWAKLIPATNFQITHDFINQMVETHQFNKDELLFIFSQIDFEANDKTQKKVTQKSVKKPLSWDKYRSLFITEERIHDGVQFWQKHHAELARAAEKYQIPEEIIVAILGIETHYGRRKGTHPTLATLATLAFGQHYRKQFYTRELREFLLMTRENAIPPLFVKGSYAGAMGYAQFIASSYRYYAVDFNADGKVDLFSDPIDAIGSIANYLHQHHWQKNGEFARPIDLHNAQKKYAAISLNKPEKTAQYWRNKGFNIDADINDASKIAFIQLPQQTNNETWLTFWNFYALTRYNHDNRYAMAAYQLSKKLKIAYNRASKISDTQPTYHEKN